MVNVQESGRLLHEGPTIASEGPRGQDPELTRAEPGVGNRADVPIEVFQNELSVDDSDLHEGSQENHAENEIFHDADSVENVSAVVESDTDEHHYAPRPPPVNNVVIYGDQGEPPMVDAIIL